MSTAFGYRLARGRALFNKRPLLMACFCFAAGIYLGLTAFHRLGVALAVLVAGCALAFGRRAPLLCLCLFCLLFGLLRVQIAIFPPLLGEGERGQIEGRVCEAPEEDKEGLLLTLDRARFMGEPIKGRVSLLVKSEGIWLNYGDWVRVENASLWPPAKPKMQHGFDERLFYWSKGISALGRAHDKVAITPGRLDAYGLLLALRTQLTKGLHALYGPRLGALAGGMLLGDKTSMPPATLSGFQAAGMAHLLAVSGLHVSLLTGALLFLLRRFQPVTRLWVTTVFLSVYCAMTAFASSAVRAGIMALCLLSGQALKRRGDSLSALALSGLILLVINPFALFSAGFLLSYTAVLGILLLYPPIKDRLFVLPSPFGEGLSVTVSAQLGALPVTARFFGRIPLMGIFSNVLAVPLAGFALIPSLCAALLLPLAPPIARLLSVIGRGALLLLEAAAAFTARYKALGLSAPSMAASLLTLLCFAFFSRYCLLSSKHRGVLGGLCLLLGFIFWRLKL